jgi:hypothetical protein
MTTGSGPRSGSKPWTTTLPSSRTLRERFFELKRLRKQVEELERMAAKDRVAKHNLPSLARSLDCHTGIAPSFKRAKNERFSISTHLHQVRRARDRS